MSPEETTVTDIVWQDPPTGPREKGLARAFAAEAEQLRRHPKRWALLRTFGSQPAASSFKSQALKGDKVAFRPVGAWEFRVSGCDLYARYVGEDES